MTLTPTPAASASRAGAEARAGAGGQQQRGRERQQQQRVVVRAADGEHEQHRVQPDERRAPSAGECPRRAAARAISATAPRLELTAIALNAHSPPASPSGAVA